MRKYIIKYGKNSDHTIYEVEIEKDKAPDLFDKKEWRAFIIAPASLYEKSKRDGKSYPPLWYSHAFYDTLEIAQNELIKNVKMDITLTKSKAAREYIEATEDEVKLELQNTKIELLPFP